MILEKILSVLRHTLLYWQWVCYVWFLLCWTLILLYWGNWEWYHKGCWSFLKYFPVSIDVIMWFLPLFLFMLYFTFFQLLMFNQICIPRIKQTWTLFIFLMCCWIWFASLFLRILLLCLSRLLFRFFLLVPSSGFERRMRLIECVGSSSFHAYFIG